MKGPQRWTIWISSLLTTVTGVVYWWMKNVLQPVDEFAIVNHPWQPLMLKAHIITAPLLVFAVGWIMTDHIVKHYRSGVRAGRRTGLTMAVVMAPMVFSGYLIQAVTSVGWLRAMVWVHVVTGGVYAVVVVLHHRYFRGSRAPRRQQAPAS